MNDYKLRYSSGSSTRSSLAFKPITWVQLVFEIAPFAAYFST